MFARARWSLTIWFACALAVVLTVAGLGVYLSARTTLFDQINADLQVRATREALLLAPLLSERTLGGHLSRGVAIGPAFTAGGYFYALVTQNGDILAQTPNVDPEGLASTEDLKRALEQGPTFVDTRSSEGDNLRVYVQSPPRQRDLGLILQVGRSTEPERQALDRLLFILIGADFSGLFLAFVGGFFLAGRALAPIRMAMDRERVFVADASHELRTPLALIRANAEFMKRHLGQPVQDNITYVDDIIQETDRLSGLVGQMLTLAQGESVQGKPTMTSVDLGGLVSETCRHMQRLAEPKDITIENRTAGLLKVEGDPQRLRELTAILIDNGIKYSAPGTSVLVRAELVAGKVQLQVSDNGRGISPESLPHIFKRFYRVDKARSREMGGTGLGLAIAKWIVESHQGKIWVESTLGVGTIVTVVLPAFSSG